MTNHEIAMEAYYYSINNELIGGISKKMQSNALNRLLRCWIQMKDLIFHSLL
jgi:hypothetical protein